MFKNSTISKEFKDNQKLKIYPIESLEVSDAGRYFSQIFK